MNTQELVERLRADADFIDADTYDECWEVKETPRGKTLRAVASRLSEMEAEIKRLRDNLIEYRISDYVSVVRRTNAETGSIAFAVKQGGEVLNRDGSWEYEPLPSSRTEDFIERTRFSFDEAAARARAALEHQQKGEGL